MTTTNGGSNGDLPIHRPCSVGETPQHHEVVRHLTLALTRHMRQLHHQGLPVPREVEELAGLLRQLATARQGSPTITAPLEAGRAIQKPDRLLVTKREAAERLGVSVRTLERLVATGRMKQVHVERLARFRVSDLEAYVSGLAPKQGHPADSERPDSE